MDNLTIYRNKKTAFGVNFDTDLTDYNGVWFMVKRTVEDSDEEAVISKEMDVADPETGAANITLNPEDVDIEVGNYVWDVQAISTNETDSTLTLSGIMVVLPTVRHDNPIIATT